MEQNSSKPGAKDSEKNFALFQTFTNIEKEWESLKQSNSKQRTSSSSSSIPRRCSTGSNSALTSFDHLLVDVESSPRGLMSSLQYKRSPSDGFLNAKNWDMSVEEIIRERRVAIRTGKVKGRRLFGAGEGGSEEVELDYDDGGCGESEVCNELSDLNPGCGSVSNGKRSRGAGEEDHGELPGSFPVSCSFLDSSSVEEVTVVEVADKRCEGTKLRGCGGTKYKVAVAWCALVIILVTLGLVVISCNGNAHEFDVFLVPT